MVKRGRAALRAGDSVRAEHYFALAIANGHPEAELLPEILAACLLANRLRSALNYAEPSLRRQPKDAELRYLVATIHLGLGQLSTARSELETLILHHPNHADGHFLLGMLAMAKKPDEGVLHLQRYLVLKPHGDKSNEAVETIERSQLLTQNALQRSDPVDAQEAASRALVLPRAEVSPRTEGSPWLATEGASQ